MNEHSIRYQGWRVAAAGGMGVFLASSNVTSTRECGRSLRSRRAVIAAVLDSGRGDFGASVAQNAAIVHLPALLMDRGVPAHLGALAMVAMGGASLAGRLFTGWLIDRVFAPRVSCVLLVLLALGTFLLAGARSFSAGAVAS